MWETKCLLWVNSWIPETFFNGLCKVFCICIICCVHISKKQIFLENIECLQLGEGFISSISIVRTTFCTWWIVLKKQNIVMAAFEWHQCCLFQCSRYSDWHLCTPHEYFLGVWLSWNMFSINLLMNLLFTAKPWKSNSIFMALSVIGLYRLDKEPHNLLDRF